MAAANPTTTLRLDAALKRRIKRLADASQRSSHATMLEAIGEYADREERRAQFRQDALTAWNDYRQARLHLDAKEADAWLAELAAGLDLEPPACHV